MKYKELILDQIVVVMPEIVEDWSGSEKAIGFMMRVNQQCMNAWRNNEDHRTFIPDPNNTYGINYSLKHLRPATHGETTAYTQGIKNISKIPISFKSETINDYSIY